MCKLIFKTQSASFILKLLSITQKRVYNLSPSFRNENRHALSSGGDMNHIMDLAETLMCDGFQREGDVAMNKLAINTQSILCVVNTIPR